MNSRVNDRIERAARIDICEGDDEAVERESGIRDLLGDILVYCRDHNIRFEKVMMDAILERID
jgi:hypothetical protein